MPFLRSRYPSRHLGVQLFSRGASAGPESAEKEIAPLMIHAFAWTWVFVDGPLFLGMLTPQSSPLLENVCLMFIFVTAGRMFQLGQGYFINKAFIESNGEQRYNIKSDPKIFGCQVVALLSYFCSLFCLLIGMMHFMVPFGFIANMMDSPAYALQICFLIIVMLAPEIVKIGFLIYLSYEKDVTPSFILTFYSSIFTAECILRLSLAFGTVFGLAQYFQDQNQLLFKYING